MPKLPIVSGSELVKILTKLGYEVKRQKGSHIMLKKSFDIGEHNLTIPNHKEIAKGTLNDILEKVSIWNNVSKSKLLEML